MINLRQMLLAALTSTLLASPATAGEPIMSKKVYAQYSYEYQCVLQKLHDDISRKEAALTTLDQRFGLTEDNFDEFDALVSEYEKDDELTERVRQLVSEKCK